MSTSISNEITDEPLTSTVRPASDSVITVRVIKSFPYRNIKNIILSRINLKTTTPDALLDSVKRKISTEGAYRPYRGVEYDSLKIYSKAHGSKSMNLVINFSNDEQDEALFLKGKEKSLWSLGVENETEISCFKLEDYKKFIENPEEVW